jgi:rhodanese-related sulfurtransferase
MDIPEIDVVAAMSAVTGGANLIDVREQVEWDAGHAPAALLLPMSELGDRLDELPEGELLVICHSGARSARVVEALLHRGYDAINVAGGMVAWQAAGGDTVPAPSV